MLTSFHFLGAKMTVKVHFLFSYLEKIPETQVEVSERRGERFHQDIKVMEERYQGRWDMHMMAE